MEADARLAPEIMENIITIQLVCLQNIGDHSSKGRLTTLVGQPIQLVTLISLFWLLPLVGMIRRHDSSTPGKKNTGQLIGSYTLTPSTTFRAIFLLI